MTLVAPSLLSADFSRLADDVAHMEASGADWHHVDVMDNHFVPNLAFSPSLQATLQKFSKLPLDTHLMMTHPSTLFEPFIKAGSEVITIHVECEENVEELLKDLKARGIRPGISLKPGTPVEALESYLSMVDLVLVMTVEPGFGGQNFMPDMTKKIQWLSEQRKQGLGDYLIEVDGGINVDTGAQCVEAGADILVSGSFLYGADDRQSPIQAMKALKKP